MIPSDRQLLRSLRRAAGTVAGSVGNAIDVILNELLLRSDNRFYLDYYRRGLALAEEGALRLRLGDEAIARKLSGLPKALDPDLSSAAIGKATEQLTSCLEALTDAAGAPRGEPHRDYLARITDWQVSLFRHQLESMDASPGEEARPALTRDRLQAYLRNEFPAWKELEVTAFEPLPGGFQKVTTLFATEDRTNGRQELVMRAEQEGDIIRLDGGAIDKEYLTLRIAYDAGIPVPEPLWLEEDASALGARFLVSRRAVGRNYGTVVAASEALSKELLQSLVTELARIHAVRLDPSSDLVRRSHFLNWLKFATVTENTRRYVDYWFELVADGPRSASPLIRRTLNWLRANVPDCTDPPAFLHGDYGLHNILIVDQKVSAILDWEASRVGDPADELSWLLNSAESFLPREELLDLYRKAGGRPVTAERIRYYDVLTCLKMTVVCNVALSRLESLGENLNLGVIGLKFNYPFASRLNALIEKAEKA